MTELADAAIKHNERLAQTTCERCPYNTQYTEITGESFAAECDEIRDFDPSGISCGLASLAVYALASEDKANYINVPSTAEERGL